MLYTASTVFEYVCSTPLLCTHAARLLVTLRFLIGVKCLSCNRALPTATTHTNAHGTATTVSSGASWYPGTTGSSSKRTATFKGDRSASLEPLLLHEHTVLASESGSNSGNSSSSAHAQLLALHHKSRGQTQVTVTPGKLQAGEVLIGSSSADELPYGFDTTDNSSTTTGSTTARTQSLVFAKSGVTSSMIPVTAASASRGIRGSALETRGEGSKQVARHHSLASTSTTSTGSLLPTLDDFDNGQQSAVAASANGSSSNVTIVSKYSNRLTPLSPQKPAPAAHKLYTVSSGSSNSSN
eukprot:1785-Heterococcus_DN1.PRE.15